MKINFLAVAISFSLAACVSTTNEQTAKSILDDEYATNVAPVVASIGIETKHTTVAKKVSPKQSIIANGEVEITLEQIMADPDWMGRSPQRWYWGDDSNSVFYQQKRAGSPVRDLFRQTLSASDAAKVKLAELHTVSDNGAQLNKAASHEVYSFKGNIFVKEVQTGKVQQLTYTSADESSAMFLNNGNVAYRVANKFFEHDLSNNQIKELANLKLEDAAKESEASYIAKEQAQLINYVALQARNKELREDQKEKLKAQNSTITKSEFVLGAGKRLVHASLSPNGDKLIVSLASSISSRQDSDIMPNYIASDGHIKAQKVRPRVANNRQYSEELILLDLKSGQQFPLSYETLPGFDEDVLASVKKENHQVFFCEPKDLYYSEGSVKVCFKEVMDPINSLEDVGLSKSSALLEFDYVFMRKDPPVNEQYMNALFILNQAAIDGCKVINDPASLMTFNEKMFALQFSDFMPNTLVTCNDEDFIEFGKNHQPFILKPLNGMGGESIYKFDQVTDEEIGIFQSLSKNNTHVMLQSFLPEIYDGDFRILIIHGEVCPIALARIPQEGSFKGNLAAGGKGIAKEISTQQKNVAKEIGKILIKNTKLRNDFVWWLR